MMFVMTGLAPSQNVLMLIIRLCLGLFFVLARFRYFYDPSRPDQPWFNKARYNHLRWKMCTCHFPKWLAPFVGTIEVSAGLGVLFGFLSALSGVGLFFLTIVATTCTAKQKVMEQNPVDWIDVISCYFWRVEILYISMALIVALNGGGLYSFDHLIQEYVL